MERLISLDSLLAELKPTDDVIQILIKIGTAPVVAASCEKTCLACKNWVSHDMVEGFCLGLPVNGDDATTIETEATDFCSYWKGADQDDHA